MSKELLLIKKDLYLNEFINKYKLSDEYIEANINKFLRVLASRSRCQKCKGLYECVQNSKGERFDIKYDGVILQEIEYCDYALSKLKKDNLTKAYVYCDIPDSLKDICLDKVKYTDKQKNLVGKLSLILNNDTNKGLYISGKLGVGKTYLCAALANSLVKKGEKVAFVKVSNFFNVMKSYLSSNSDLFDQKISDLQKVKYLILDDIGSEAVSEFVRDDILFRILDYRLENKLTTIFTSNLSIEDLKEHYTYDRKDKANSTKAERLVERIEILSEEYVLDGENLRRKNND